MLDLFAGLAVAALSLLAAGDVRLPARNPTAHHARVAQAPRPASELFAFRSNVWVNLHHFLYSTARARAGLDATRSAVMGALADTVGFGALPAAEQRAWQAAVAYYGSTLARRDLLFDSTMVGINNDLARLDAAHTARGSTLDPALASVLDGVAPAYRRLWWRRHDAANRRWEARMRELLASYGDSLSGHVSRAFGERWSRTPMRVDVTAYANWAGAYTTTGPAHITVSSTDARNQDGQGLEILFHEALHTMDGTLRAAVRAAFLAQGKTVPRDATHAFIFYTAGALTQRLLPGHVPYAEKNGLWAQVPDFARALPVLQSVWRPYLDGKATLDDAARRYASEFR